MVKLAEIVFVVENKLGGVAYLNKNIINNTSVKQDTYVKVILVNQTDSHHPRFTDIFEADEVIDFNYSGYENKYSVLKRLSEQIGNEPGAVICNEALEMESIYLHKTTKTVYQIIHDFYNLKLAVKYGAITDVYITHTMLFKDVLVSSDPVNMKCYYLPHGVTIPPPFTKNHNKNIKVVFTGRLVESKGVLDLFHIDEQLKSMGVLVDWTIIGGGPLKQRLIEQWHNAENIHFATPDTNTEVMNLMGNNDIFVLPTHFEGAPVSILEALACGLAIIVSDLPGGITEIVKPTVGRRIPLGNPGLFAEAIADFENDRNMLNEVSDNAYKLAKDIFDIRITSDNYFSLFKMFTNYKRIVKDLAPIQIGFRLDQKWMPNFIVYFLRKTFRGTAL